MVQLSELPSLTYNATRVWVPYNQSGGGSKGKGTYFFALNTTIDSISRIIKGEEEKIVNSGSIYKAYYYDYSKLPRGIKSKKVVNSGLTMAKAKKNRLSQYNLIDDQVSGILTPYTLTSLNGRNFIYDLNPIIELYGKQKKLDKVFLVERLKSYFNTINGIISTPIEKYSGDYVFVNLDDYSKYPKNSHILHNLMVLMKRSDKIISTFPTAKYKILFYNKKGFFVFDMATDINRSNLTKIKRLLARVGMAKAEKDADSTEAELVARYIEAKAKNNVVSKLTGSEDLLEDPAEVMNVDPEDEVVKTVADKAKDSVEDIAELEDGEEDIPDIVFKNEELARQYDAAITKKTAGPRSEASLKRDQELRQKQKDIKVKGRTIGEITKAKEIPPIPTHKVDIDTVTNDNLKEMKFTEFNKVYMEEIYEKDIMDSIMSLNNATIPVNIVDVQVKDTSDKLNLKETYTVILEDENRKRHKLVFNMPILIDDKYMYINGNKKSIQDQFYPYPVIKIAPDTVQVVTNYQKITLMRFGQKLSQSSEKMKKLLEDETLPIAVKKGSGGVSVNKDYLTCLEYDEYAKKYLSIKVGSATFSFNARELDELFNGKEKSTLDKYLVGYETKSGKKTPIYYDRKNTDFEDLTSLMISYGSKELQEKFNGLSTGKKYIYTNAMIMRKPVPLIVLLGFFEGLSTVIRKFDDDSVRFYTNTSDKRMQYIRFKDGYLGYPLANTEACIMFNGFTQVPTNQYTITEMDERDTYLDMFELLYGSSYVAGALITFYEFMIDPITKQILELLDYPTDLVSLLIFANNMLADNTFDGEINLSQFRLRRNEVIPVFLYKNIARAYSRYRQTANNPNPMKISMDPDAVIKEMMALPTVDDYSTLSPMVEMRKDGFVSMRGANGLNVDRSYTLDKRAYDDSMFGVIGMTTDPGPNCGVVRELVAEPKVLNARGFMDITPVSEANKLKDVNLTTAMEFVTPMTNTHDAPERNCMASKQTGHVIPVENSCPVLVSMGMDQMAHYRTGNDFSVVAKEDGKVIDYDEKSQIYIVQYKSGKKQAIDVSPRVVKNGGGGFYLANQLVSKVKNGQSFKKDAILAYDPKYYKDQGPFGNRLTTGSLMKVAVISHFSTYEDSAFVTRYMSKQMATNITMKKQLILGANANVDYIVKPGQEIEAGQDLIRYEVSYDDKELNRLLSSVRDDLKEEIINLGRSSLTSHYTGKIEDVIMYSSVEPDEMSPSLAKVYKQYLSTVKPKQKILDKYAEPTESSESAYRLGVLNTKPSDKVQPDQYGKVKGFDIGHGVLIEFYITYHDELSNGDKLAASTANKNTIGYVIPRGQEPYSLNRPYEEISAPVAPSAILQRGTPSVVITGSAYKVLIETKRAMYKILTGEDYDEVLKQKQPWMVKDEPEVLTKESTNLVPIVTREEVEILESVFCLYRTDKGYMSEKYYDVDDIVMTLDSTRNCDTIFEGFAIGNPNVYIDDETHTIRALTRLNPGTPLSLFEFV